MAVCSRSATKFLARSTSTLGHEVFAHLRDPLDQVVAALDGVEVAGVHSPVPVHQEIGVGRLKQRVILRGLDIGLPGIEGLPRDQWLEDDIAQIDVLLKAGRRRSRSSCC